MSNKPIWHDDDDLDLAPPGCAFALLLLAMFGASAAITIWLIISLIHFFQ